MQMFNNMSVIDISDVKYLEDKMIDEKGIIKVLPYSFYKDIPQEHLSQVCIKYGIYNVPTLELIDFLRGEIGKYLKGTIEIGAGNGAMATVLGILATDSYMQEDKKIKEFYGAFNQPITRYGFNVTNMEGNRAVNYFKPSVVIASWVTHKYNSAEHWREGNMFGVNEGSILKKVKKYIFIGNTKSHNCKPILDIPHKEVKAEWLLSRSLSREENMIWIWEK